jgi:hypothetical protein
MILALVVLVLLGGTLEAADASKACPTRQEARQAYGPRAYLYWYGGPNGQRCWSDRRGRRQARITVADPVVPPAAPAAPPARIVLPPERVVLPYGLTPPYMSEAVPRSILDTPQWAWVADARAALQDDERGPIFTTFPRDEPEVWPVVEQRSGTMIAMFAILLIAGAMLWRWNRSRIRWTR